jgi:opacity protein-like surface antigen
MLTTLCTAVMALTLLAGATAADAQDRAQRWQFEAGLLYQLATDLNGDGGSSMETDNDFGLSLIAGYNFTDKLETTFGLLWSSVGYDAVIVDDESVRSTISGSYDSWVFQGNLIYNFSDGAFTPYIGAGISYAWVDTGIPNGLPSTGCWWDPWWGYVCYTSYPTKTEDAFSYQAMLGVRYEFNMSTFLRFGYTSQWMDFGSTTSTPRFDVIEARIGWMF